MEILGIDIGGTGVKGAIVNTLTGELVTERHRIPTPQPATPERVAKVVKQLIEHFHWKGKVGCGFPTPQSHGKCLNSSNLDASWTGVQIDALFNKTTGLDFTVLNDADAAAVAEMSFGAGKDKKGLVAVITLGTGVGSGLFFNGALIPNTELGFVNYKDDIFEKYMAASAKKREDLSYKKWGKRLNKYFKHIDLILSPDYIIIGGGASKKMHKFEKHIDVKAEIMAAENKNEAGIIGAALAVEQGVK